MVEDVDLRSEIHLVWDPAETPPELHPLLGELGHHYPIRAGEKGVTFKRASANGLKIDNEGGRIVVTYSHLPYAGRAISYLLTGDTQHLCETPAFDTAGILLDCSRNAVPTVDYLKEWVRRMALFGFNLLMLYTEDTYQLEGEPFFGYQRGGYSKEEIRELDRYGALFGIELVPCIQTLGHMEQMLRWECYHPVRDQGPVLLAGTTAPTPSSPRWLTSGPMRLHRAGSMSGWMKRTPWDAASTWTNTGRIPESRFYCATSHGFTPSARNAGCVR